MEKYQPNHIPKTERIFNFVWGIGLLVVAYIAYSEQSFHLPGKGASSGITFAGSALWLFVSAALFGALNLFITIADHYDKRDNEFYYKRASRICSVLAVLLVISASAMQFSDNQKAPVVISNGS